MSEHSPEPWVVVQGNGKEGLVRLTDAAGFFLDNTRIHPNGDTERGMEPEDARRIVACINFCREFPTEFLEQNRLRRYQEASFKGVGYAGLIPFDTKNCADCQDPAKEPE